MDATAARGHKAAKVMFTYAIVMIVAGVVAFGLAPEGAKATTALAVPAACGLMMVLAGLLTRFHGTKPALGKLGLGLGLALSLLFAGVIGMRAMKTGEAVAAYQETSAAWEAGPGGLASDEGAIMSAAKKAFFDAADAPDHDKSYLRNTLWFLTAASVIAFGAVIVNRPRVDPAA